MRGAVTAVLILVTGVSIVALFNSNILSSRGPLADSSANTTVPSATERVFLSPDDAKRSADAGLALPEVRSILRVERQMRYGDFVWHDTQVPEGPIVVLVNLRSQLISVYRGGHEIGTAVILYGVDQHETPIGSFPVLAKARDYRSVTYDAPMPFSLRLTADGVAIHGSDVRWGAATHGCIGVPLEFARRLFEEAQVGDVVRIV